jgi:hypothetical protein
LKQYIYICNRNGNEFWHSFVFLPVAEKEYTWLQNINIIKKNTQALLQANREVGLEVNTLKTKYSIWLMSRHQTAEENKIYCLLINPLKIQQISDIWK